MEVDTAAVDVLGRQGQVPAREGLGQQNHATGPAGGASLAWFAERGRGRQQQPGLGFRPAVSAGPFLTASFGQVPHQHGDRLALDRDLDAPAYGCIGGALLCCFFRCRNTAA